MTRTNVEICPMCGESSLEKREQEEVFTYKGYKKSIPNYPVLVCDACGEELVDASDSKKFEKVRTDFRRKVDGLLTSDEIKSLRINLGYTQKKFAEILKVGEKNFARYENGSSTQSRTMDNLLRVLREFPFTLKAFYQEEQEEIKFNSSSIRVLRADSSSHVAWKKEDFERGEEYELLAETG